MDIGKAIHKILSDNSPELNGDEDIVSCCVYLLKSARRFLVSLDIFEKELQLLGFSHTSATTISSAL